MISVLVFSVFPVFLVSMVVQHITTVPTSSMILVDSCYSVVLYTNRYKEKVESANASPFIGGRRGTGSPLQIVVTIGTL